MNIMHLLVHRLVRRRMQASACRLVQILPAVAFHLVHKVDKAQPPRRLLPAPAAPPPRRRQTECRSPGRCSRSSTNSHPPRSPALSSARRSPPASRPAVSEYTKPEQPAEMSNPHACGIPSFFCTRQAVEGYIMSGVTVPTMIDLHRAQIHVVTRRQIAARRLPPGRWCPRPESTICRSRIPVRSKIHSLEVATIFSRSQLERTRGGTYEPRAVILARILCIQLPNLR